MRLSLAPLMLASILSTIAGCIAVQRRFVAGYLGPGRCIVDELPADRSPANLATLESAGCATAVGDEISVLSYNIKRAERMDAAAASLDAAVREHRPDVILLQEAPPEFLRRSAAADLFRNRSVFFAPFHQVDRPDRKYLFRQYGQVIATSCRMLHNEVIELPTVNPTSLGAGHILKRIALYTELPVADGRVVGLVNAHNEPFTYPARRLHQFTTVLDCLDRRATDVDLYCGDLNPTLSQRRELGIRLLERRGFSNAFAGRWRALDNCFAIGHRAILSARTLPLPGSDHRPILVRIAL